MSKTYSKPFDFEEWMLLAKSDTEEFKKRRKHLKEFEQPLGGLNA